MADFVDVYVIATGRKQRVPRAHLTHPDLGPLIRRTPMQRVHDGDLPPRPAADAPKAELKSYAAEAGVDLTGAKSNGDILTLIEDLEHAPPVLEPEFTPDLEDQPEDPTDPGDNPSPDETPAAGGQE